MGVGVHVPCVREGGAAHAYRLSAGGESWWREQGRGPPCLSPCLIDVDAGLSGELQQLPPDPWACGGPGLAIHHSYNCASGSGRDDAHAARCLFGCWQRCRCAGGPLANMEVKGSCVKLIVSQPAVNPNRSTLWILGGSLTSVHCQQGESELTDASGRVGVDFTECNVSVGPPGTDCVGLDVNGLFNLHRHVAICVVVGPHDSESCASAASAAFESLRVCVHGTVSV